MARNNRRGPWFTGMPGIYCSRPRRGGYGKPRPRWPIGARRSSSDGASACRVEQLNDRFGTDFSDVEKLLFDQFEETWVADAELSDQAQNNSLENFRHAFDRKFMHTIVTWIDDNSEIFKRILDDDEFSDLLREYYLKKVYSQVRDAA
jgi:type I restriction enzyme R subunit